MNLEWEQEKSRDNVLTGTVGAFLGALLGVVCIILVDQLGYVSTVGGVVMAVCAIKGYALLGGCFSKRGAVISSLMLLVMPYIANKICFALEATKLGSVEGAGFFDVYQNLYLVLADGETKRAYLGSLVMLYLFTLLGGIPAVISALREPAGHPAESEMTWTQERQSELQGEFYTLQKKWMRPLRLSILVPVLGNMAVAIVILLVMGFSLNSKWMIAIVAGCLFSSMILFFAAVPLINLCNALPFMYVRAGGRLWQVNLRKFCNVTDWEKQSPSRQAAIKWDILQEIEGLLERQPLSYYDAGALVELTDLRVEKEDRWSWKVSYETDTGKRKKLRIGKGYPGFCPVPGTERSQGALPYHWAFILFSITFTVALAGAFWAVIFPLEFIEEEATMTDTGSGSKTEADAEVEAKAKSIPARVPESVTEFEMSEVWFQMDGTFQYGRRTFLDGETGTSYRAYVQYGVDENDAWDTLTQFISEYRTSPLYSHFDAVYLDEDILTELNGMSKYNIVSVYLTDGCVYHTATVLSDDGTLFTIEAEHDSSEQSVEEVLANLMFTLESVRFEGPALTEENYQSQIHISDIRDCTYMAAAYIKTDHFGHDAFVDVYVPYSEAPVYAADGRSVRTESHGLRVYVTILPGKNAKDVIEAWHQELVAAGQVYEEGVEDEEYREDLDAACKLTVYEEDGQERYAVLYADSKWDGYYLVREITGLPELVDEEYPALLAELEDIIGLNMPVLEELGK